MAYNETVREYRIAYIDAAIAEMNALANLIENDDKDKYQLLDNRASELGKVAQQRWLEFVDTARIYHPDNPAFGLGDSDANANEN